MGKKKEKPPSSDEARRDAFLRKIAEIKRKKKRKKEKEQ